VTIFLSGPMGAGKSTLARAFSESGARVIDLDAAIEARVGVSAAEIIRTRGEAELRTIERALARELVHAADVMALGGGTVIDRALRRELLRAGTLITLTASTDVLARRIGDAADRPLLGTDVRGSLARIVEARADAYAECHATLDTTDATPGALVERVRAIHAERPIVVPLGTRTYGIRVGAGVVARVENEVERLTPTRVVLVCDRNTRQHASIVFRRLAERVPLTEIVLEPGERHKTLTTVASIWDTAIDAGADRRALVIAVGGGVVGDVAGFAAATLLRGVAFAQVPTSLLAMADASVGGKTAIDLAQGKNLVGAMHQPRFVLADLDALATLPAREHRSGLAEIVKAAWLAGEDDVRVLEREASELVSDPYRVAEPLRRALATKIAIVAEDELETGIRAHLNLGHTVGHAIEAASGYARTHGECVALGLVAALRVGVALGDATASDLARMTRLLDTLGLLTDADDVLRDPRLLDYIRRDKKRDGDTVRFIVPGQPGNVRIERIEAAKIVSMARG
jgi:shikimate kinase/3-dehydroquinate synthase